MIEDFWEFPAVTYNFDCFVFPRLEVAYFIFLRQTIGL